MIERRTYRAGTEKHDAAVESAVEDAEDRALPRGEQRREAESRHKKTESADAQQHQTLKHTSSTTKQSKEQY